MNPQLASETSTKTSVGFSGCREAFDICVLKTRRNVPDLAKSNRTWSNHPSGDYPEFNEGFFEIGNWTTSFFTGMGVLAWLDSEDEQFLRDLELVAGNYIAKMSDKHAGDTMHDLGFLYTLYSVAIYKTTGQPHHREVGLKAARVLADRFVENGNYIRAWGRMDAPNEETAGLAIIDCMMNLPLLYWASKETGDPKYSEIAVRHSDTSLKAFIREDDSVYHACRFDEQGRLTGGDNYCGHALESHWARGTTWAMYGYALGYRHTGHARYLDASMRLTRKFITLLDDEMVPVWDFLLPEGAEVVRDSSAAAIAVCAIQELEILGKAEPAMISAKDAMLNRLISPDYLDGNPACRGVLKQAQVGSSIAGEAKNAYASWGDYYLMEALGRQIGLPINWW